MSKAERNPEPEVEKANLQQVKQLLSQLKRNFRKWYATISVNELISNKELVLEIENFERMLAKQGV